MRKRGCTEITSLPQCTKHFSPPFADDSLILIQANQGDCTHLQMILQLYEDCSIRARSSTKRSQQYFLARTQSRARRRWCVIFCELQRKRWMSSIWGCQCMWEGPRWTLLLIWKTESGWNEKFFVLGGEGDLDQGSCAGYPNLHDGLLRSLKNPMWSNWSNDMSFLVESTERKAQNPLTE